MIKFLIIVCMLMPLALCAQDIPQKTQQQLENLADVADLENDQDDSYLQQLDYFRKHPINLNTASAGDLQQLRILNDLQIQHFLLYRKQFGNLVSIYELQAIPTWDVTVIGKLLPFITMGPAVSITESLASRIRGGEQTVLFRVSRVWEPSRGYNPNVTNRYQGDRNRLFLRYRYQYRNLLYWGALGDKDAGEPFFRRPQSSGFDFYSVHLFARQIGRFKAVALGDYTVNMGQGLIHWQSLAFGKSIDVMNIKRQSEILLPYRSPGEFLFNRGGAFTLGFGSWEATAFASFRKISGNLSDSNSFSSFQSSGLHRNASEIADRHKVAHTSFGGNLSYRSSSLKTGINIVSHQLTPPYIRRREPYTYFSFRGGQLWNASLDYSYTFKNFHVFGEYAVDKNWNRAWVTGVLASLHPKMDLALLHRNLNERYQNFTGNAFTESTLPINENGTYAAISLHPAKGWQVNAYADVFRFPWLRYLVDAPSIGSDYLLHVEYEPNRRSELYALFRVKSRGVNQKGSETDFVINQPRQSLRLHFATQLSKSFVLKGRGEALWYDKGGAEAEEGFLAFAEGVYRRKVWQANMRLQYFETGGYNSRIYAYESDVLYSFSIPAFFNQGFRYYLNGSVDVGSKLTCWFRFAQSIFQNQSKIGSGLDEINGNRRTDVRFQIMYRF